MKSKKIILTVPHGCSDRNEICDLNAKEIAKETFLFLGQAKLPYDLHLLINEIPRMQIDMNRPEARGTVFRERIDALVEDADILLFDVHSFPPNIEGWEGIEVGIFDLPTPKDDAFTEQLTTLFTETGIKTKKIDVTSRLNDIAECQKCELTDKTVLIEFNQQLDVKKTALKFAEIIKKLARES